MGLKPYAPMGGVEVLGKRSRGTEKPGIKAKAEEEEKRLVVKTGPLLPATPKTNGQRMVHRCATPEWRVAKRESENRKVKIET
jgi:hypothetical protein